MTDLTDRMRTCAAHIVQIEMQFHEVEGETRSNLPVRVTRDAVNLLLEAANELEKPIEARLGEPMVTIEYNVVEPPLPPTAPTAQWVGDDLKPIPNQPISKNACPNCDSRTTKIVRAAGRQIELECPVCGFKWRR